MATQAEIEAAAMAIQAIEDPLEPVSEFIPAARAALEAAERVRPRRDLTAAARMRQSRAKRRAERCGARPMAARPLKSTRPMAALLEVAQTADSPV